MAKVIGIFDSGIGGKTTAEEIRKILPGNPIIYYGDHENCPYGERTQEELIEITSKIVKKLASQGAELIVIACNTATTQCIRALRERFPQIIFVGTEPAIKVACDAGCRNILLLATPATIKSAQAQRLIERNITSQKIQLLACPGLADLIESTPSLESPEIVAKLDELLKTFPDCESIDGVVLGCTHYIYLRSSFQKYFPRAKIFDGNLGVAKRVQKLLDDKLE